MSKSWQWRHAISIWLHFHRAHSLHMNDCGRWAKKFTKSAADHEILHLGPVRSDRASFFTAGMHWPSVSGSSWGLLTSSLVYFFFPLFPCHFQVNYSIQNPNWNVDFRRKHLTWIQVRHDDITRNQVSRELQPSGTWANCNQVTVFSIKLIQISRNKLRGQSKWKTRVRGQSVAARLGKSRDQVGSKTTNHVTCL
jgi:hypothetical protein